MQLRIAGEIRQSADAPHPSHEKLWLHENAEALVHHERQIREKGETQWLKSTRNG
jgi:hypothetical protein